MAPVDASDPGAIRASLAATRDNLEALLDDAPDDLRDALGTARKAAADLAERLEEVDPADASALAVLIPELEQVSEDLSEARQAVEEWVAENCRTGASG